MNKLEALLKYFAKKYPSNQYQYVSQFTGFSLNTYIAFPSHLYPEIEAFFTAWDAAYGEGYADASKVAAVEYSKNIQEIVMKVSAASHNEGFAAGVEQGFDTGVDQERIASYIPSDAYDIEVFAVQPSHEFPTGKQAFIGYKFDIDGQTQFHFIQASFAVPNVTTKPKINGNEFQQIAN